MQQLNYFGESRFGVLGGLRSGVEPDLWILISGTVMVDTDALCIHSLSKIEPTLDFRGVLGGRAMEADRGGT